MKYLFISFAQEAIRFYLASVEAEIQHSLHSEGQVLEQKCYGPFIHVQETGLNINEITEREFVDGTFFNKTSDDAEFLIKRQKLFYIFYFAHDYRMYLEFNLSHSRLGFQCD